MNFSLWGGSLTGCRHILLFKWILHNTELSLYILLRLSRGIHVQFFDLSLFFKTGKTNSTFKAFFTLPPINWHFVLSACHFPSTILSASINEEHHMAPSLPFTPLWLLSRSVFILPIFWCIFSLLALSRALPLSDHWELTPLCHRVTCLPAGFSCC